MSRLRYLTAGESHGRALVGVLEGLPAGLEVTEDQIRTDLARRRLGHGRGPRMKVEKDVVRILSGVRSGRTLGSPVAIMIENSEWEKWSHVMPVEGEPGGRPLTRPRPGHADLVGMLKYGFEDARDVLERASARETAARVGIAVLAKRLLAELGIRTIAHVTRIGDVAAQSGSLPGPNDLQALDDSPVRTLDREGEGRMIEAIDAAASEGDSLGGVVEALAYGVPPGLGSHVHWDRRLDGRIAGALMAVPGMKAVWFGDGMQVAGTRGSEAHDEILEGLERKTDRAGGVEGGMSIGGTLRVSAAMKPLSTLKKRLRTVDMATGDPAEAFQERTDVCAVPAASVVCESVLALVLADAVLEMFGGDTVGDLVESHSRYMERVASRSRP